MAADIAQTRSMPSGKVTSTRAAHMTTSEYLGPLMSS
jgi:hypothetical protein